MIAGSDWGKEDLNENPSITFLFTAAAYSRRLKSLISIRAVVGLRQHHRMIFIMGICRPSQTDLATNQTNWFGFLYTC